MADKIATREAYGNALAELGEKYDIVVLDADLAEAVSSATACSYCSLFGALPCQPA